MKLEDIIDTTLSLAEIERLALLIEEAAEVQQICTKILRHGWISCHPESGKSNRELLHRELGDFSFARLLLIKSGDLNGMMLTAAHADAWERKQKFLHHQGDILK
jgi:hypothetical protein